MADIRDPRCSHCGRAMVMIGIGPAAEPCCPKDGGACSSCRAPASAVELVSATTEHREVPSLDFHPWFGLGQSTTERWLVATTRCRRCRKLSTTERRAPEAAKP